MIDTRTLNPPPTLKNIEAETKALDFRMASDPLTGSLLRTLATSKPASAFLELGTGTGMSAAWILDGMDSKSKLLTVDNDAQVLAVARRYLGHDPRIEIRQEDGALLIEALLEQGQSFDFIFADTWVGKLLVLTFSVVTPFIVCYQSIDVR